MTQQTAQLFGWIPPEERTTLEHEAHERAMASMPAFALPGYREDTGRFALWRIAQEMNSGRHIPFAHQVTGSCVGAGGSNMLRILARVEISQGDAEEWQELWWPYTYGQSRLRAGMRGRGEGSLGSAWAEAIVQDGIFAVTEAQGLPSFRDVAGWLQLARSEELEWSDGAATKSRYGELGRKHPVGTAAPIRNAQEAKAALQNGYPLTCASNFGTRGPRLRGEPAVQLAEWDATWPHQMSINEAWDHPSLGLIFHIQNNWGPQAHPEPTQGEPPGGFYVTAATLDRICRDEVFAFSRFQGFVARELNWYL